MRRLIMIGGNLLVAVTIGFILMCLVFLLPLNNIENNVYKSAFIMQEEGAWPDLSRIFTSKIDNFTDSIMLLEAANHSDEPIVVQAMNEYRGIIKDYTPDKVVALHYIEGQPFSDIITYSRYWHGYLIILKPLLEIIDYHKLRILNGLIQVLVFALSCFLMYRNQNKYFLVTWILAYFMLMPIALARSLQFSACFYIPIIASIIIMYINGERARQIVPFVFLNIGIVTAFFDLLSYPIATVGIPLVVYLMTLEHENLKKKILSIIELLFLWGIGYLGMWMSKWILSSLITGDNIIQDAILNIIKHVSNADMDGTHRYGTLQTIIANYKAFIKTPVIVFSLLFFLFLLYQYIVLYNKGRRLHSDKPQIFRHVEILIPYLIICSLPIVWYIVVIHHSAVHFWFANKACVVSFLGIFFGMSAILQQMNNGKQ